MSTDYSNLKRPRHPMPEFVQQALEESDLMAAFWERPAYQQNDYVGWINRAKRQATKEKRLRQMLEELEMGGVYMNMAHPASRPSGGKVGETQNMVQRALGYAVWIPHTTPKGQEVTIQTSERSGNHVMHAETPDQSELYFEVTAYRGMLDHGALARDQQDFLRDQSEDGTFTEFTQGVVANHAGTTFDFRGTLQGRWKERRFLFLDGPNRTYRVVHDPTSALNVRSLETLEFHRDGDA